MLLALVPHFQLAGGGVRIDARFAQRVEGELLEELPTLPTLPRIEKHKEEHKRGAHHYGDV